MQRRKLTAQEVESGLSSLKGWKLTGGKLQKEFAFADFVQAFGFMASVALHAEALNHHPDWSNVYNRVTIGLWTHDLGGISTFDLELASRIDKLHP